MSFGYTADNELVSSSITRSMNGGQPVTTTGGYGYDALGRLIRLDASGTQLRYEGDQLVTEQVASGASGGAILRRYVPGPDGDDPIMWYEGAGANDRRWLYQDERGSVIAVADQNGNATQALTYDEYGIPGVGNGNTRFQYTGQLWLGEAGLYHYKARAYSPTLGRFLQTDPIGQGGGINLYEYVGGNPVNATDPTGLVKIEGLLVKPYSDPPREEVLVTGERLPRIDFSNLLMPRLDRINLNFGAAGGGGGGEAPQNKTCSRNYSPVDMASANVSPLSSEFSKLNALPNLSSSAGWRSAYTPHATGGGFEHDLPGGSGMVVKVYIGDTHNGGANTVTITSPTWSATHIMEQLDYYGGSNINEQHAKKFMKGIGGC